MSRNRLRGLVGVLGLVVFGWWVARGDSGAEGARWLTVTRGDLVMRVEFEGTLAALHSKLLSPPIVPGRWEYKISHMASDGADVKEGEVVLAFDTTELERLLLDRNAALESAKKEIERKRTNITIRRRNDDLRRAEARANLEKIALKLERPEEFVAAKEIALLELDRELAQKKVIYLEGRRGLLDEADEVELGILQEQRDQAAVHVLELGIGIERMTLRSSHDGTVIHVTNRRGEKKRVGDTVWRRDQILKIPDLTLMMARGIVDEADAGRLVVGQRAELRLDAYPDVTFRGTIRKIATTVQPKTRNSPLRVVRVDVGLDETDENRMRPEMRFRGTIEFERHANVLLAPVGAIHQAVSSAMVYRRSFSGTEERRVKLGARDADNVEVVDGLSDGDQVWTRQ
jgi:HlyD family secretion protein